MTLVLPSRPRKGATLSSPSHVDGIAASPLRYFVKAKRDAHSTLSALGLYLFVGTCCFVAFLAYASGIPIAVAEVYRELIPGKVHGSDWRDIMSIYLLNATV